jgi:peptide deformylase
VSLAKSDRGWISGVAGEGIVTIGDPGLTAPTATVASAGDVADLLTSMVEVEVRKTDVFPDRPAGGHSWTRLDDDRNLRI